MPNWCENRLEITCSSEQIEEIKAKLFSINPDSGGYYVDFNQLVPMPSVLLDSACTFSRSYQLFLLKPTKRFSIRDIKQCIPREEQKRIRLLAKQCRWTIARFLHWLEKRPQEQRRLRIDLLLAKQHANNIVQFGYTDSYHWAYGNWGCKWTANEHSCSVSIEDGNITCEFDTPWNPPEAWFRSLCTAFPDLEIRLAYFESGEWFAGELISDMNGGYSYCSIDTDEDIREFACREFGCDFNEDDED